jgi:hypothetical protein
LYRHWCLWYCRGKEAEVEANVTAGCIGALAFTFGVIITPILILTVTGFLPTRADLSISIWPIRLPPSASLRLLEVGFMVYGLGFRV